MLRCLHGDNKRPMPCWGALGMAAFTPAPQPTQQLNAAQRAIAHQGHGNNFMVPQVHACRWKLETWACLGAQACQRGAPTLSLQTYFPNNLSPTLTN